MLKKIGYHVSATEDLLIDRLERKIRAQVDDQDFDFPIVDRNLYSAEPWQVLKDNDPNWQITHSENKSSRTMFVFTPLNRSGKKRFHRAASAGKWDGGTGGKPVKCKNGLVIGTRSYFEFKLPAGNIVPGHWSMHEYRLPREDNWNQAVCKITHEVDKGLGINWTKTPLAIRLDDFKNRGFFNKRNQCVIPDKEVDQENMRNKRLKVQQETGSSLKLITDEDKKYANELEDLLNESNVGGEDSNQPVDGENPGMEAATNQQEVDEENPSMEAATNQQQEVNDMDEPINWNLIDEEHQLQPVDEENPGMEAATNQQVNDMDDPIDWNLIDEEHQLQPVDEKNPGMEAATNQQVNDMDDPIDWNLIDEEHQLQPFDEPNLSEEDLRLSISVDDLLNMLGDDKCRVVV